MTIRELAGPHRSGARDAAITSGVFVHEHAGETETLRVIHRVGSDGRVRAAAVDGRLGPRVHPHAAAQLTCYLPDQRTVLVEKSTDAGLLLGSLPRIDAASAG